MIILKVAKNQGFTLSLEDTLFEKSQGGQTDPPSRSRVKGHNKIEHHWKLRNYTKNCKFRSISEMRASYVNYLQKNI